MVDNRRGTKQGRREGDDWWERVEERLVNLTSAQQASQHTTLTLTQQVGDLKEHVQDVDEFLRGGPTGKDTPIGVRVMQAEIKLHEQAALFNRIAQDLSELRALVERGLQEIRADISSITLRDSITEKHREVGEQTRLTKFMAWLTFWGPIAVLVLGGIGWGIEYVVTHWDTVRPKLQGALNPHMDAEAYREEIEADKKGAAGKAVRAKEAELERIRRQRR